MIERTFKRTFATWTYDDARRYIGSISHTLSIYFEILHDLSYNMPRFIEWEVVVPYGSSVSNQGSSDSRGIRRAAAYHSSNEHFNV